MPRAHTAKYITPWNRLRPTLLWLLGAVALTAGCGTPAPLDTTPIEVGGLYTDEDENGRWRVVKVLAVDNNAVHLRLYANVFDSQPANIDPADLTLAPTDANDPTSGGVGHLPMAKDGFLEYRKLIQVEPVTDEELEGYKLYKKATRLGSE